MLRSEGKTADERTVMNFVEVNGFSSFTETGNDGSESVRLVDVRDSAAVFLGSSTYFKGFPSLLTSKQRGNSFMSRS
jgi:hypothetical protein